jgi:hypothetical protein
MQFLYKNFLREIPTYKFYVNSFNGPISEPGRPGRFLPRRLVFLVALFASGRFRGLLVRILLGINHLVELGGEDNEINCDIIVYQIFEF